jgi:plastocyanin
MQLGTVPVLAAAAALLSFGLIGATKAWAETQATSPHAWYGPAMRPRTSKGSVHRQVAKEPHVKISNFKFGPRTVTVKAGTKVVWTNKDAIAHSVNFDTVHVDSKTLDQDAKFSHTFTAPGRYPYICAIHPFMHGTIVVTS